MLDKWFPRHVIDDAMGVFGTQVWSYGASVLPIPATDTFQNPMDVLKVAQTEQWAELLSGVQLRFFFISTKMA